MAVGKHDHSQVLAQVRQKLPPEDLLCDLGELFKVFGDTTRIRILYALLEAELCVCALAELLHMEQSAISHQLKILRGARLVSRRREGKTNVYSLADSHVRSIIDQGFEHITENNRSNKGEPSHG